MGFTKHYFPPTRNFIFIGRFWFDEVFYSYVAKKYCLVCTVHDLVCIFNINKITSTLTTCYTKHFHAPTTHRKPNKLIMVTKKLLMNNVDDPHHCTHWWKLGEFETTMKFHCWFLQLHINDNWKTTRLKPLLLLFHVCSVVNS